MLDDQTRSVLSQLRRQTQPMHDALEAALDLLSPRMDRDRYAQRLEDFLGFYGPYEESLHRSGELLALMSRERDRRKVPLLRDDLAFFGRTPDVIESLPRCSRLPPMATGPQQLGCMYVIEGSTLGGQVVLRHLGPRLGISASAGGRFFNSYGRDVGTMWKSFLAELARGCATDEAGNEAVRAATSTFECLLAWFARQR